MAHSNTILWRSAWPAWLGGLALLGLSSSALAQPADSVRWGSGWQKVQHYEYVASAAFLGGTIAIGMAVDQRATGSRGGVLFDGAVRRALRARTLAGRETARVVGDFGYRTMLVFPALDAALAWALHGDGEVAWQMLAIDLEVMSFAGLIAFVTDHFIGRARPSEAECARDPAYERFCNHSDEFGSFVSGHTLMAATAAGATCAHHLNLPLYGGGAADVIACAAGAALAITTAVARVMNDRHWASDVAVGLVLGAALGYLWPRTMHYGGARPDFYLSPIVTTRSFEGRIAGYF